MRRTVKRILWSILILVVVVLVGLAVTIGPMIYSAMVGYKHYETTPPKLPNDLGDKAILIFSKTNGFRDDAQITAANVALSAVFNAADLSRFKAVVWNSVSGDVLTTAQRADFKAWLEKGGGFVALHGSGGDPHYAWDWYVNDLIGTQFIGHTLSPHIQQARLVVEDPAHPAMRDLGQIWTRSDEWYSFATNPRAKGYHILITIDESSYKPVEGLIPFTKPKDISMGKDHPMVWWHCVDRGRAFYSALGHTPESYSEPKHQALMRGAISWAARLEGTDCDQPESKN